MSFWKNFISIKHLTKEEALDRIAFHHSYGKLNNDKIEIDAETFRCRIMHSYLYEIIFSYLPILIIYSLIFIIDIITSTSLILLIEILTLYLILHSYLMWFKLRRILLLKTSSDTWKKIIFEYRFTKIYKKYNRSIWTGEQK